MKRQLDKYREKTGEVSSSSTCIPNMITLACMVVEKSFTKNFTKQRTDRKTDGRKDGRTDGQMLASIPRHFQSGI